MPHRRPRPAPAAGGGHGPRTGWGRYWAVIAVLALIPFLIGALRATWHPGAQPQLHASAERTVYLLVTGLTWDQFQTEAASPGAEPARDVTPGQWLIANANQRAAVLTKAQAQVACPVDGWLSLGALARVTDLPGRLDPQPAALTASTEASAALIPSTATAALAASDTTVICRDLETDATPLDSYWPALSAALAATNSTAEPGQLGAIVAGAGASDQLRFEGPGGVWAAGPNPLPAAPATPGEVRARVVDLGSINPHFPVSTHLQPTPADGPPRYPAPTDTTPAYELLTRIAAEVASIQATQPDTDIVVASIADTASTPGLGVYLRFAPNSAPQLNTVSSGSTGLTGLITVADIGADIALQAAGTLPASVFAGTAAAPLVPVTASNLDITARANRAAAFAPAQVRAMGLWLGWGGVTAAIIGLGLFLARRQPPTGPHRLRRLTLVGAWTALIPALMPGVTGLVAWIPWWRAVPLTAGHEWQAAALLFGIYALAAAALLAVCAGVVRLRRGYCDLRETTRLGAILGLAALLSIVALPRVTLDSLFGSGTLSGWRLTGVGNTLMAAALGYLCAWLYLVLAEAAPDPWGIGRRLRTRPLLIVATVTIIALSFGVGGINFGAIPPFAMIAALTYGWLRRGRYGLWELVMGAATTLALWAAVGLGDLAFGPTNHIGRFMLHLIEGDGLVFIAAKARSLSTALGGPLVWGSLLAIAALGAIYVATNSRLAARFTATAGRSYLAICGLAVVAAVALNDSGVIILAASLLCGGLPIAAAHAGARLGSVGH